MTNFDDLRRRIRSNLNLDVPTCTLGTEAGEIYVPGRPGYVYVRIKQSDSFSAPIQVRCQATIQLIAGNPAYLGRDFDGELCVLRPAVDAQIQAGFNPLNNNPAAQISYQYVSQERFLTAVSFPLDPPVMKVGVKPLKFIYNDTIYTFAGAATSTLTAPSAGQHQLVGLFIKTSDQTLETVTSTAQDILDDFDDTDIQQLLDGASAATIPIWAWRLYGGQTSITVDDSYLDMRQFINMPDVGGTSSTLTTKGDILSRSSSTEVRLPVGASGHVLYADATQTSGLLWAAPTTGTLTAKGDILTRDSTGLARLGVGTDGYILKANSSTATGLEWAVNTGGGTLSGTLAYIQIADRKAQNTSGGTFTSGAWRTRDLNTEVADAGGYASVASNQITLAAGNYRCQIGAPAYGVARHQAKLYNVTDAADLIFGDSGYSSPTNAGLDISWVRGTFSLASQKTLEVRHRCQTTLATFGYGVEGNFATEIYTVAEFWKE